VHCILGAGECPAGKSVDCNHDGANTIDDVLCCAHVMLGGDLPPDTTGGRVEPAVTVRLREPVRTATGMDLPLTLVGADRVGAARLELVFPTGRYDVAGVDFGGDPSSWLNLHETNADHLVIGLIGLPGAADGAQSAVDLVVHFALKPGQSAGGDVTLAGTQFSGPDGVALKTAIGQPSRTLGPPARVALTASRPNPFSSQTRFSVNLAVAGELDVSVYDLQGRLVTNLYRGHAEAGNVDLVWKRTRGDGTAVPSGIYFYRAVAGSASATSKVVVMSRE
jgi:hypothetical protein